MLYTLFDICKFCFVNGAYLLYGLLVFLVSIALATEHRTADQRIGRDDAGLPPIPGGELPFPLPRPQPRTFIVTDIVVFMLALANFTFFRQIVQTAVQFIKTVFLMRDNPSPLRSFWRYFNLYYLAIVLPAAFMPPVAHLQRPPDFHLLFAVVLLICINAIGDVISVRLILHNFRHFEPTGPEHTPRDNFWQNTRNEAMYYLAVAKGGTYSLAVLIGVLAASSVLYGVQIGELDFAFSTEFLVKAWGRILKFSELPSELYWFRDRPGPFGFAGVPGLFIYGLTTFIPIIVLFCLAVIWLLLLPFRVAVNLPPATSPVLRVIAAEGAVVILCVTISYLLRVNV